MAILRRADRGAFVALAAHCLIGRSPTCTLRVDEPKASREHARLTFASGAWSVRDLGSSNGTYVNGDRLPSGATRALAEGDRIGFGDAAAWWALADASPPVAMARRLDDDATIRAEDGILALPSGDAPMASVFDGEDGSWIVEIDGQARAARDGEVLSVAGAAFMLHLPVTSASTVDAGTAGPVVSDVELRFHVSRDEELVEVAVALPSGSRVLAPRSHHYTWLTLARARVRDRTEPGLSEAQRGWLMVDELCRSLRMDETRLNVEIHRIRQGIAAMGLCDAASVIERRRGARQLRLGTDRVVIVRASTA